MKFKNITHILAVAVAAVCAFALTPAGMSLAKQYPTVATLFAGFAAIAALYHVPVKQAATMILLALLLCGGAMAQTTTPPATTTPAASGSSLSTYTWTTTLNAVNLPGKNGTNSTLAGTFTGVALAVTPNFSLVQENYVSSSATTSAFYGGVAYRLAPLSKWLNDLSPNLNGYNFNFRVVAEVGADHVTQATGATSEHWTWGVHVPVTYQFNGGPWGLAADLGWLNLTGVTPRNNVRFALGPTFSF